MYGKPLILSDLPVPAGGKYYFHFEAYAKALVDVIQSADTSTPLNIWINGYWGSGKTTLLKELQRQLRANPSDERVTKVVWFNAWKYAKQDSILTGLINAIIFQMKQEGFIEKIHALSLDPSRPNYKVSESVISLASQILSLGQIDVDPVKYEKKNRFQENFPFFDDFEQAFDRLLKSYLSTAFSQKVDDRQGVLVVFVDDLDRCSPSTAVDTLETMKLFMDKQGVIFVIGADLSIIRKAVDVHYRKNGFTELSVVDYLEKMIQLRFDLPPIHPREMQVFIHELPSVNEKLRAHLRSLASFLSMNPRKIKNFINHLNLQWAIIENSGLSALMKKELFIEWFILNTLCPEFTYEIKKIDDSEKRVALIRMVKLYFSRKTAVHINRGSALINGKKILGLSRIEIALLNNLVSNQGRYLSISELSRLLGAYFLDTSNNPTNLIETAFQNLLVKIEDDMQSPQILLSRMQGDSREFCLLSGKNTPEVQNFLCEILGEEKFGLLQRDPVLENIMMDGEFEYTEDTIELYIHMSDAPGITSVEKRE